MRNNLILNSEYEYILLREARKSGYFNKIPYPDGVDWLSREESDNIYEEINGKIGKNKINNLYQMLLLYDCVTIPSFIEWDDYSKLEQTGYIKINTYDSMKKYMSNLYGNLDYEYGQYIKPALFSSIKKIIKNYNYCKFESDEKFTSIIYDLYLMSKIDVINFQKMVNDNIIMLSFNANVFRGKVIEPVKFHQNIVMNYIYFLFNWLEVNVDNLLWDINLSYSYNAIILNSEYDIERIGLNQEVNPKDDFNTYRTLKVELKKIIGVLPHANSLEEIFYLKDKHEKDIIRLRTVIDELEYVLREYGKEKMIIEASNNIKKASKELAKTDKLDEVSKWATYLSVPTTVVETILSLPPIAGLSLGIAGTYTTKKANDIKRKNNWLSVIR